MLAPGYIQVLSRRRFGSGSPPVAVPASASPLTPVPGGDKGNSPLPLREPPPPPPPLLPPSLPPGPPSCPADSPAGTFTATPFETGEVPLILPLPPSPPLLLPASAPSSGAPPPAAAAAAEAAEASSEPTNIGVVPELEGPALSLPLPPPPLLLLSAAAPPPSPPSSPPSLLEDGDSDDGAGLAEAAVSAPKVSSSLSSSSPYATSFKPAFFASCVWGWNRVVCGLVQTSVWRAEEIGVERTPARRVEFQPYPRKPRLYRNTPSTLYF